MTSELNSPIQNPLDHLKNIIITKVAVYLVANDYKALFWNVSNMQVRHPDVASAHMPWCIYKMDWAIIFLFSPPHIAWIFYATCHLHIFPLCYKMFKHFISGLSDVTQRKNNLYIAVQ